MFVLDDQKAGSIMSDNLFGTSESPVSIPGMGASKFASHQLVVLGNGFDLECGLPTRFSHFFKPRLAALEEQDWERSETLGGLGYEASPTVWDFLLRSRMYAPWYSVEDAINDLILSAGDGKSGATGLAAQLIERIHGLAIAGEGKTDCFDEGEKLVSDEEDLLNNVTEFVAIDCADELRENDELWSPQKLVEYLGNQLGKLEENFSNYMLAVTKDNGSYIERSFSLLGWMLADVRPSDDFGNLKSTILSFNYTNPFKHSIGKSEAVKIINVHGSLDEGIIFGIDGTKCADNSLAFPFSKTYRVITAGTNFGEGVVHASGNGVLSRATQVIKFYGHSLGEADYAYFQAIFDSVNLYASDTKLVFYYKPHARPGMSADGDHPSEEKRSRNAMAARVTRLLSEYGKTLDNEDHGKNLMHKLMIEGRLEVRLLQDDQPSA